MGQKVSPHGLRVGIIKDWSSKWYANKEDFSDILVQDNTIRKFLKKKLYEAGISKIVIERPNENEISIDLLVEKPGLVIGSGGEGINKIKDKLTRMTKKNIIMNIFETQNSSTDAQLVAEKIALDLERRMPFRRAMKSAFRNVLDQGVLGVKMVVSGRLNGAEIARAEKYSEGMVPLHTLRANIDYGFAEADTTYGKLGVKIWINQGEQLDSNLLPEISDEIRNSKGEGRKGKGGSGSSSFSNRRSNDRRGFQQRGESFKIRNPRIKPKSAEEMPKKKENLDAEEAASNENQTQIPTPKNDAAATTPNQNTTEAKTDANNNVDNKAENKAPENATENTQPANNAADNATPEAPKTPDNAPENVTEKAGENVAPKNDEASTEAKANENAGENKTEEKGDDQK